MGAIDVASIVASILAAFNSSIDVFNRLKGKKRPTHARPPRPSEEEEWLRHSLTGRPLEIRQVYDRSRATHGHSFEMGDGPAHSSLAHTLLVLNTGLINLLNNALHRDPKTRASSRRTLYNLSETAALDTLSALGQLNSRLSMTIPSMPISRQDRQPSAKRHRRHKQQQQQPPLPPPEPVSSSKKHNPLPPPSLLAQGGEVRSKNGPSVVSAAEARKLRRDVNSHDMPRSKSPLPKGSASQISLIKTKTRKTSKSARNDDASAQQGTNTNNDGNPLRISSHSDESWQAEREPSILLMSNACFEEQPLRNPVHVVPPKSSSVPQSRPMSTATFLSTSTKIGEIPEHRRSDRNKPLDRQTPRRMPHPIPPPLDPQLSITKASRFKFWKRPQKPPAASFV